MLGHSDFADNAYSVQYMYSVVNKCKNDILAAGHNRFKLLFHSSPHRSDQVYIKFNFKTKLVRI